MLYTYSKILFYVNIISADWVKLPNISPTTKVQNVIFKLAPPKNSILSSEIMNNIFSTTESSAFSENISTRKSYIRQYFKATVTSKITNVLGNLSNVTNSSDDSLEPIILRAPQNNQNRVIFFNKTVQMNVIPVKTHHIIAKNETIHQNNNDDDADDGIIIADEPDDVYYDDEYYYEYDDGETSKFHLQKPFSTSSTTTDMPAKTHKRKSFNPKLERRTVMEMMKNKQYKPFGDISFPSFVRFIKTIQESFAIRTAKTIAEKIKMLVHFRDQLMLTINKQIRRLWKVQPQSKLRKSSGGNKRIKRTLGMDHSSGAMDFPSAEGALLSICFLTFAVFLIKLVLQLIQTIKMKKAMWATQMMMGTENVVIKRQQRDTEIDEELRNLTNIYESIEKLRLKY